MAKKMPRLMVSRKAVILGIAKINTNPTLVAKILAKQTEDVREKLEGKPRFTFATGRRKARKKA